MNTVTGVGSNWEPICNDGDSYIMFLLVLINLNISSFYRCGENKTYLSLKTYTSTNEFH